MGNSAKKNGGFCLLELLVSLPVTAVLLAAFASTFLLFFRQYICAISDRELFEELQFSAECIVRDLCYAEQADVLPDRLYIWTRRRSPGLHQIEYVLNRNTGGVLTKDNQPLTGGVSYGKIQITRFSCQQIDDSVILFELEGKNESTGKCIVIKTGAFLKNSEYLPEGSGNR